MSKYNITHECGCSHEHNLVGPHIRRDHKITWLEGQLCPACVRAKKQEQDAIANTGLPALTGSDKQVAWALSIRASAAVKLTAARAIAASHLETSPQAAQAIAVIDQSLANPSASYWIEHRDATFDLPWVGKALKGAAK